MHHSGQIKPYDPAKKERYGRKRQKERASEAGQRQVKEAERQACEDDDCEDGDIATPKRDRDGNDDEPL
jgi:hypothetical protein